MTDTGERPVTKPAGPTTSAICPYLLASGGGWRSASASRDHRCTALAPATVLTPEKQRRLCLSAAHATCTTFLAAAGLADLGATHPIRVGALARPIPRTTPVVFDQGRVPPAIQAIAGARGVGQGGLVAVMAVAFGALVAARLSGGGPDLLPTAGGGGASASPGPTADTAATATPTGEAAPTADSPSRTLVPTEGEPTPAPTATAAPTDQPSVAPSATGGPATHTVARGDSLSAIAARHGTTWQVLAELNGISDPRSLRIGQVLQLP